MLYFAYGSNLDPDQMKERCPESTVVGLASLDDYRIAFPRFSNRWGGGTASIQLAHGEKMWGIVYEVTESDMASLDRYEGFQGAEDQHNVHDRDQVTLDLVRADDGSIPRRVRAWTYIARPAHASPPSPRYKETMLRGAEHFKLPEEYVTLLRGLETEPEPEPES